jgi:hypothetical protein
MDPDYRGCLVCASWGGNIDAVQALQRYYGVENNMELIFSLNKQELNKVINSSKVNILLSYKEGSNRSLFESMFSGIPVICLAENIGVNKSYINEHTGLLISDKFLEDGLLHVKRNWDKYRVRQWALDNISPESTTERLVSVIDAWAKQVSTGDVFVKTNNPEVSYLHYPNIEFKDINMHILDLFTSDRRGKVDIGDIIACRNEFMNRISAAGQ